MKTAIFWFRRDLRLEDNTALHHALQSGMQVLALFILDDNILHSLPVNDPRLTFIYDILQDIHNKLRSKGSSLKTVKGRPTEIWEKLLKEYDIGGIYFNKDYEPDAIERDKDIRQLLTTHNIPVHAFKDQVIFEEEDVLKKDGTPYTVFTPYKRKWLEQFNPSLAVSLHNTRFENFYKASFNFPSLNEIGFKRSVIKVKNYNLSRLNQYAELRNLPGADGGSYLGPHLRFGTISIRQVIRQLPAGCDIFLSELIWREFFMQILYHFPHAVKANFNAKYDGIEWLNNPEKFERWRAGKTGYPMVDAGMRQLNQTGYMHNRVRMICASFLCKHLLIHWSWGERYFAGRLLDFELSSNNGNWQWAAGTGCDAAPYFRVFNPTEQLKKFDKELKYVKQWLPEYGTDQYPTPMIEHTFARGRAIDVYRRGLKK